MGALLDGYCSDCTRTFAAGELDDRGARGLRARPRRAGGRRSRRFGPGVGGTRGRRGRARDDPRGGHGDHFGHGLGHGVGLEVHEAPRLGQRSEDVLVAGDVVTVEPGVYLPGRFGVRIEDLVAITDDGHRNLSSLPKELRVVS